MITRRAFMKLAGSGILAASALGSYAFGFEPMIRLQTTYYRPELPTWPKKLNLRIAALADIHACKPWMTVERIRKIVHRTNALKPDLIVLLGDYSAGMNLVRDDVHSSQWAPVLGELEAPLGVYAILGNHDWWEDHAAQRSGTGPTFGQKALEAAGITVLENDAVKLEKDNQHVWLAGLGDQLAFPPSQRFGRKHWGRRDDLAGTLKQVKDDGPVILLAHEPDIFPQVPEQVQITLAGHTHGGQVRLFGYAPITASGAKYNYGHVREWKRQMIVSGGLGCSMLPVRFGSPPEIVMVELDNKKPV